MSPNLQYTQMLIVAIPFAAIQSALLVQTLSGEQVQME